MATSRTFPSINNSSIHLPLSNSSPISWASVARNLRAVRKQRGWTLQEVELRSRGRWKAVVVGSYERTDRALSIEKAIELANFYNVPFADLLGVSTAKALSNENEYGLEVGHIVIDLRKISTNENSQVLTLFAAWITTNRQDWNGEVLSIRRSDLATLALMLNLSLLEAERYLRNYLVKSNN
jgi:transcriptional regulator with XRE-family HTH domain